MRMQQLSNRSSGYEEGREQEFLCVVDRIAVAVVATQIFPIYSLQLSVYLVACLGCAFVTIDAYI